MRLYLLGPVRAAVGEQRVPLGGEKPQTVLATLLLYGKHGVSVDRLSWLLWRDSFPRTANTQIHTYVSRLRMKLRPVAGIEHRHGGYAMEVWDSRALWIDLHEFNALVSYAHSQLTQGLYEQAASALHSALALWPTPALANVTDYLIDAAQPTLNEVRLSVLEAQITVDLRLGRHASLVPQLARLVHEHPYRETLRAQLMTTLCHCDRRGDAITAFHEGRRILAEDLGVDPGKALQDTYRAILRDEVVAEQQIDLNKTSSELTAAFEAHLGAPSNSVGTDGTPFLGLREGQHAAPGLSPHPAAAA